MSETAIVSIILGILGLLGGGGFWGYRQFKKEAPVKKRDADIAVAEKSQQMAMAIADDLRGDYTRLRADLNTEREHRERLTGRVDGLETHIRELNGTIRHLRDAVRLLTDWGNDIVTRWDVIRLQSKPPKMPHTRTD
ncbi:hypothetical protein ACTXI0_04515 [Arthrobacter rhombi]|uniref:hypothetical protein n=1 Tax=Arthrobacter rhombi TaxID=71253 RepID=UPI003FD5FF87